MANTSNIRFWRAQEGLPVSDGSSSPPSAPNKKKWSNFMPLLVALVVISEIAFLGRLDMANNAAFFDSWPEFFHTTAASHRGSCEEWLESADAVVYARDFDKDPIWVSISGKQQEWKNCSVGCKFGRNPSGIHDAAFTLAKQAGRYHVLRSMESSIYYAENDIIKARRRGFDVVMTTSLSSDVPVGYFSWAEYDFMAPIKPKTENALAAAFISNCDAQNFRMQAFLELRQANVTIDSYGLCYRNRDGRVDKVETLKHYKFSLAFENSNEEDYVTEKFFQSLVAGTIPVVVGAPNIEDFAPLPDSLLHIKTLDDAKSVAKRIKYLAENPDAYNHLLRWKHEGPSESFKALVDMAVVHSSCRLCIHLATKIREEEETRANFKKRPCKCTRGLETVYHLYVRERGTFKMDSIFLRSGDLTLAALESAVLTKFQSQKREPVWKPERPESLKGGGELKVYKIYPVGLTQRQALYEFRFNGDPDLRTHIETNPCAKFEVVFV